MKGAQGQGTGRTRRQRKNQCSTASGEAATRHPSAFRNDYTGCAHQGAVLHVQHGNGGQNERKTHASTPKRGRHQHKTEVQRVCRSAIAQLRGEAAAPTPATSHNALPYRLGLWLHLQFRRHNLRGQERHHATASLGYEGYHTKSARQQARTLAWSRRNVWNSGHLHTASMVASCNGTEGRANVARWDNAQAGRATAHRSDPRLEVFPPLVQKHGGMRAKQLLGRARWRFWHAPPQLQRKNRKRARQG